jgi:hypothetical protein
MTQSIPELIERVQKTQHGFTDIQRTADEVIAENTAAEWAVRDVIAHLTAYYRWFVNASEAHFRGELPPEEGTESMDFGDCYEHYREHIPSIRAWL